MIHSASLQANVPLLLRTDQNGFKNRDESGQFFSRLAFRQLAVILLDVADLRPLVEPVLTVILSEPQNVKKIKNKAATFKFFTEK